MKSGELGAGWRAAWSGFLIWVLCEIGSDLRRSGKEERIRVVLQKDHSGSDVEQFVKLWVMTCSGS